MDRSLVLARHLAWVGRSVVRGTCLWTLWIKCPQGSNGPWSVAVCVLCGLERGPKFFSHFSQERDAVCRAGNGGRGHGGSDHCRSGVFSGSTPCPCNRSLCRIPNLHSGI